MANLRKLGRFYCSRDFIQTLNMVDAGYLFHNMIPMRCEYDLLKDRFEYVCIHEDFLELEEGAEIPLYGSTFIPNYIYPRWALQ